MAERSKVPVLEEDNYSTWSLRIRCLLEQRRVWEAIDPGYDEDDDNLTVRDKNKDMDARNLIIQSVSDEFLKDIKQCKRAKDMWEILATVNCNVGTLQIITTLEEMCTFKKPDEMSMRSYITKIQSLCDKLDLAGLTFSDTAIAAFILRGLRKDKYEGLVRSLEWNEEKMTVKEVKSKLLLEDKRDQLDKNRKEEEEKVRALAVNKQYKHQGASV